MEAHRRFPSLGVVLIVFVVIHGALLIHDALDSGAIYAGDRVPARIGKIKTLVEALGNGQSLTPILTRTGDPGDYAFHAFLYGVSGMWGLIIFQIFLMGVGGAFLYRLVDFLFKSEKLAGIATLAFFLMPGSVYHPHTVMTEGIADPLLIIYTYILVKVLSEKTRKYSSLIVLGLIATILSSLRLIYVLYPLVTFGLLMWDKHARKLAPAGVFVLVSILLPALWVGFNRVETGDLSYGRSDHSLALNVRGKLERMHRFDNDVTVEISATGPVRQLITQSVSHPVAFLKTARSDMFNMLFNSGVNTVAGRYLGLYQMPKDRKYWAALRDRGGIVAMVSNIFRQSPTMVVANIVFGIAWVAFLALSIFGLFLLAKMRSVDPYARFALISLPVYFVVLSLAATNVRWDHRSPLEFVLCIGFVAAVFWRTHRNGQISHPTRAGQAD